MSMKMIGVCFPVNCVTEFFSHVSLAYQLKDVLGGKIF